MKSSLCFQWAAMDRFTVVATISAPVAFKQRFLIRAW